MYDDVVTMFHDLKINFYSIFLKVYSYVDKYVYIYLKMDILSFPLTLSRAAFYKRALDLRTNPTEVFFCTLNRHRAAVHRPLYL